MLFQSLAEAPCLWVATQHTHLDSGCLTARAKRQYHNDGPDQDQIDRHVLSGSKRDLESSICLNDREFDVGLKVWRNSLSGL